MKQLVKTIIFIPAITTMLFLSNFAYGESHAMAYGNITMTLVHPEAYGGCMIHLDTSLPSPCPAGGWVSVDCEGVHRPKEIQATMFTQALLAYSLGKQVGVLVDLRPEYMVSGYCTAWRLDTF